MGGSKYASVTKAVKTIHLHLTKNTMANYLLFLNAHSDYASGELIFGQNWEGADVSDSIDEVRV